MRHLFLRSRTSYSEHSRRRILRRSQRFFEPKRHIKFSQKTKFVSFFFTNFEIFIIFVYIKNNIKTKQTIKNVFWSRNELADSK